MTVVSQGALDDVRKHVLGNAKLTQTGRQPQRTGHVANRLFDCVLISQANGLSDSSHLVLGHNRLGLAVECDDGGKKNRIERAVVQAWINAAQGVTEAVNATQALLEGQGALQ